MAKIAGRRPFPAPYWPILGAILAKKVLETPTLHLQLSTVSVTASPRRACWLATSMGTYAPGPGNGRGCRVWPRRLPAKPAGAPGVQFGISALG